jgi:hypothetical protein
MWGLAAAALVQPAAALAKGQEGKAAEAKEQKLPDPLTHEVIRELTSRLTDAEVRQLLIQQLDRAAAMNEKLNRLIYAEVGEDRGQMLPGGIDAGWEVNRETMAP